MVFILWKRQGLLRHAAISSVTEGITRNLCKQDLWFLCSACHLLMLNICMMLQKHILNGFHITVRTRFFSHELLSYKVQRSITQTTYKGSYCSCTLHGRLIMLKICTKFYEDILNSFNLNV